MVFKKVATFLEMIKFEHTVFALPFAYLGALLAGPGLPTWSNIFWISLAMVGARTAAMSLNRMIDRHIDALNPRTANRAMATGAVGLTEAWVYVILSFSLLIYSASMLNELCLQLLPIAVFFLVVYSYTKRFTWTCHLFLGVAIGLAPMGSWVGITAGLEAGAWLLGLAVAAWVAGFDILYACQDFKFDRSQGLHSIPARFGLKKAMLIAASLHVLSIFLLVAAGVVVGTGLWYYAGVVVSAGLLFYEHRLVAPDDLSKMNAAFFAMNGYISLTMFSFTLLDVIL